MIHRFTSVRFLKVGVPLATLVPVNANKVKIDTPIPDNLRLWRSDKNNYILRSNTPMTLDGKGRSPNN